MEVPKKGYGLRPRNGFNRVSGCAPDFPFIFLYLRFLIEQCSYLLDAAKLTHLGDKFYILIDYESPPI